MLFDHIPQVINKVSPRFLTATLQAVPSAGFYDFTVGTVPQQLFEDPGSGLFYWDSYSVSSDAPELSILQGIGPASLASGVTLNVQWGNIPGGANSFFPPFKVQNLFSQKFIRIFQKSPNATVEPVFLVANGTIGQGGFTVPPPYITLFVEFQVYEIRDAEFISRFNSHGDGTQGLSVL